ncbi:MAG: sigma-54 dependent transcriptional regulator [Thermodesulfovibrionales bacterium]|nr:sigma-54 dependent transcriptional regulator [Thermodesulfovibrionales bacterium]
MIQERNMSGKILVVDDEKDILRALEFILSREGYTVTTATNGQEAMELLKNEEYDLVLTDLRMPGMDGMEVLEKSLQLRPSTAVIIMTAYATVESAVQAMRMGASDYIVKPFINEDVKLRVKRLLEHRKLREENILLRQQLSQRIPGRVFLGNSNQIQQLLSLLEQVIPTKSNVLILGESGTGKGLVAELIHYNSPRKDKPFISINCSAIPETLLESELFGYKKGAFTGAVSDKKGLITMADGGTIFLDEIGDMPMSIQAKLLKVIETGEIMPLGDTVKRTVDVRIIAATNADLEQRVKEGKFREDLYYRLSVIEIKIPPLRERKEDIPVLVNYFIRTLSEENKKNIRGIDNEAMALLIQYPWPGNVRELKNVIERAVVLAKGEYITPAELPDKLKSSAAEQPSQGRLREALTEFEKSLIINTYEQHNKDKEATAKALGIDLVTLYRKLKKYGIEG